MLADRIRRGERLGRNCRRPRFSEIWEKTGPGPSKQVRNPPVHIWSEGQSQVRVLSVVDEFPSYFCFPDVEAVAGDGATRFLYPALALPRVRIVASAPFHFLKK